MVSLATVKLGRAPLSVGMGSTTFWKSNCSNSSSRNIRKPVWLLDLRIKCTEKMTQFGQMTDLMQCSIFPNCLGIQGASSLTYYINRAPKQISIKSIHAIIQLLTNALTHWCTQSSMKSVPLRKISNFVVKTHHVKLCIFYCSVSVFFLFCVSSLNSLMNG